MSRVFTHAVRAGLALALSTAAALAQSAVFSGKVTSAGQPLGGASVGIVELGVGATTAVDGTYSFTVPVGGNAGRSVTLRARAIGYTPKQATVTLAAGRIEKEFALDKDVLNLEQVVVTGVGDATSQKKTAFSVGVVDASQIKEAPSSSPVGALAGRVAGASVVTVSGQPGQAPAIRLRAATSLTGSADPLIIIDGTITRMTLADINTEDVERMEVIKGAAASSLYGSDAANGVVQIFTKRGAQLVYADGTVLTHVKGKGVSFYGTEGEIHVNRGKFEFVRDTKVIHKFWDKEVDKGTSLEREVTLTEREFLADAKVKLYNSKSHFQDFMDAVVSRKRPICDVAIGASTAIACHVMNFAYHYGANAKWDPVRNKFAGFNSGGDSRWLTRERYRDNWGV